MKDSALIRVLTFFKDYPKTAFKEPQIAYMLSLSSTDSLVDALHKLVSMELIEPYQARGKNLYTLNWDNALTSHILIYLSENEGKHYLLKILFDIDCDEISIDSDCTAIAFDKLESFEMVISEDGAFSIDPDCTVTAFDKLESFEMVISEDGALMISEDGHTYIKSEQAILNYFKI